MSLIRFLSSGSRALTKGPKPLGRYQLPAGRVLPDFSSPKNPFNKDLSLTGEASSSPACVTARAASTQAAPPSPAPSSSATSDRSERGTASRFRWIRPILARLTSVASTLGASWKRLPSFVRTMFQRIKLRGLRRRSPFASSGSTRQPSPVQGELSLDRVQVVRNDLTETDYEVVCAETATATPVKRVPQTVAVSAPRRPLGRLAERLFNHKAR